MKNRTVVEKFPIRNLTGWINQNKYLFGEYLKIWSVDRRVSSGRRCSTRTSLYSSRQSAVASSLQHALKPAMHILNKVFDCNIALLASFVTADDCSSSYEPAGLSLLQFLSIWLWLSNNYTECFVLQGIVVAIIR